MPKGRDFIDSAGIRGRPRIAPKGEINLIGRLSRSYDKNIKAEDKLIHIEFKNEYFLFDFSKVVGNKIKVRKANIQLFANWILKTLEEKDAPRKPEKTKLAREDKSDSLFTRKDD